MLPCPPWSRQPTASSSKPTDRQRRSGPRSSAPKACWPVLCQPPVALFDGCLTDTAAASASSSVTVVGQAKLHTVPRPGCSMTAGIPDAGKTESSFPGIASCHALGTTRDCAIDGAACLLRSRQLVASRALSRENEDD